MKHSIFLCRAAKRLLGATALASIATASPALAQETSDRGAREQSTAKPDSQGDETQSDEIVVTATRLGRPDVPTPILQLDAKTLAEGGRGSIIASLQDFPQFRPSDSPALAGGGFRGGRYSVDLRGLGALRTLPLLNGRRFAAGSSGPNGDVSVIPSILVERVDVVTGSASATWGSGAVAGVVNFIFTDDLEGLRLGAQAGISSRGDAGEIKFEGAFGTSFADGRGRFIIGGEYVDNEGIASRTARENVGRWAVINGVLTPDVGLANVSRGGLILTGANAGQAFNPDGTLYTFNPGQIVGNNRVGGDAPATDDVVNLTAPTTRYSIVGRLLYDVTDDIKLTAELLHSRTTANYTYFPQYAPLGANAITISVSNAFLPAAVRAQMIAAGETSFRMGRFNEDFAALTADTDRTTTQGTLALDGKFAETMRWNAFYTYGQQRSLSRGKNSIITSNYLQSIDSVLDAAGNPICRVRLTTPSSNCVPINLFGEGAPSQAARDYVLGDSIDIGTTKLSAGGVSINGEPFELWAGPVSIALGADARKETFRQENGPLDRLGAFIILNASRFGGSISTVEGFGEVMVPILRDVPFFKLLQFNAAARYSDNSQSSGIWSWKVGAINEVADGVTLRFTRSRDIRAPTVDELFSPQGGPSRTFVVDPQTSTSYQISEFRGGNPNLDIEVSDTMTIGATFAPRAVPSLNLSIDYFDINIKNAINTASSQTILNACAAGNAGACSQVIRAPGGLIDTVFATAANFLSYRTRGIDFLLHYKLPLSLPGVVSVRSGGTWLHKLETDDGVTQTNLIGTTVVFGPLGAPKFSANTSLNYDSDTFSGYVRAKYVSPSFYDRRVTTIANNKVPAYVTVDLGLSYTVNEKFRIFGNVNNVFDRDPPIGLQRPVFYDAIGRYFVAGASLKF